MKLDEVAGTGKLKCALILSAGGNRSVDADDWHGSTLVFTNKTEFFNTVKKMYEEDYASDEDADIISKAKSVEDLDECDNFDQFLRDHWIDDRF